MSAVQSCLRRVLARHILTHEAVDQVAVGLTQQTIEYLLASVFAPVKANDDLVHLLTKSVSRFTVERGIVGTHQCEQRRHTGLHTVAGTAHAIESFDEARHVIRLENGCGIGRHQRIQINLPTLFNSSEAEVGVQGKPCTKQHYGGRNGYSD